MKGMKRILGVALGLTVAMGSVFAFGACGGGNTDDSGFLGLEQGEEFVTDKEIVVTFTRPKGNDAQESWWTQTIADFNEEYSGRIKIVCQTKTRGNSREYENQISMLAASDALDDLLYVDGPFISTYANSGILVPIDNYLYEGYTDDFLDYVTEQNTYQDRLYALSIVDSTVVVFYNKTVLAQKGIDVPDEIGEAWTFEELKETAEELTESIGSNKTRYGLQIAGDAGEWLSYAFSPLFTDGVIDETGKITTGYIDGSAGVAAGEWLRSLVEDGAVYSGATSNDFSAAEPTAAMALTGTQNISEFLAIGEGNMCDWGVTFYPSDDEGKISAPCGGWTMGMTKNCAAEKRVAAVEFIKYCTSLEACESCARATSSPPSRLSLYNSMPEYSDPTHADHDVYSIIGEQVLSSAQLRAKTVGYEVFSTQLSKALKDIIYADGYDSRAKIKTRLSTAAKTIDASIAQIKIY